MKKEELINKIKDKKEFREIPRDLVERALDKVSKGNLLEEEKVKLTRSLLRKIFSSFFYKGIFSFKDKTQKDKTSTSPSPVSNSSFPAILRKHVSTKPHGSLLSSTSSSPVSNSSFPAILRKHVSTRPHRSLRSSTSSSEKVGTTRPQKNRISTSSFPLILRKHVSTKPHRSLGSSTSSFPLILRKHVSTKERLPFYEELYNRIFDGTEGTIIDLGSGVNGFSYSFLKKKIDYMGVEAVGQFVDMQNIYFRENEFPAKVIHLSLFELDKLKALIKETKKPRVVLMFKIIDALEVLERDYSKKLISEVFKISNKIILSFPIKSLSKKMRFKAERKWLLDFLKEHFRISEDFELGSERYLVILKRS